MSGERKGKRCRRKTFEEGRGEKVKAKGEDLDRGTCGGTSRDPCSLLGDMLPKSQ